MVKVVRGNEGRQVMFKVMARGKERQPCSTSM